MRDILRLALCAAFTWPSMVTWSYFQEKITTKPYQVAGATDSATFTYYSTLNLIQALSNTVVTLLVCYVAPLVFHAIRSRTFSSRRDSKKSRSEDGPSGLARVYKSGSLAAVARLSAVLGLCICLSTPLTYHATRLIPFPVVLCIKMSKTLPVMVLGTLLYGRKYSTQRYWGMCLVIAGVLGLVVGNTKTSDFVLKEVDSSFALSPGLAGAVGFSLVVAHLLFEGYVNATQDELFSRFGLSGPETMLVCNISVVLWSFFLAHGVHGEVDDAVRMLTTANGLAADIAAFALFGVAGQLAIYQTMKLFSSLSAVTIGVVRKIVSVVVSIVAHNHTLTVQQWICLVCVLGGVVADTRATISEKHAAEKKKVS